MFDWLCNFFAGAAFDAAIYSAGLASGGGMHQMKEPKGLQEMAEKNKTSKANVR